MDAAAQVALNETKCRIHPIIINIGEQLDQQNCVLYWNICYAKKVNSKENCEPQANSHKIV